MSILVGTNDLKKGGRRYPIKKLISHPNYEGLGSDIGLIQVSIKFSRYVKAVTMSTKAVKANSILYFGMYGNL